MKLRSYVEAARIYLDSVRVLRSWDKFIAETGIPWMSKYLCLDVGEHMLNRQMGIKRLAAILDKSRGLSA
jgi:hypothetical protein